MDECKETAFLLLGGNLGAVNENFKKALGLLGEKVQIYQASSLYATEAWGMPKNTPSFINQVIKVGTELKPIELLDFLQSIEHELGRIKNDGVENYQSRLIDIDILTYGDFSLASERLTLPHAHLAERLFALKPLAEIAPYLWVTHYNTSVKVLLENCSDPLNVARIEK